ncbi:hypothetical protein TSH7_09880 [Azospirillum sp. TSH7]|uniref:hypothetical protein n=1 Tax=unclassified Azospirillum TaxID=2630922 RepID=UPI000D6111CE|nr:MULTISPECIES: hypothetical protein [unclassified Azospirillum]PWC63979.1 hypothetical protein TSH20_18975 [Azospirillum sp. TSH20]PWC64842.1 hypothetical protein TSH7_09880 [Azospirillum sp. TSH7]
MTKLTPMPLADHIVELRKRAADLAERIEVDESECNSLRRRLQLLARYPNLEDERNACDTKLRATEAEVAGMRRRREYMLAELEGARMTWKEVSR